MQYTILTWLILFSVLICFCWPCHLGRERICNTRHVISNVIIFQTGKIMFLTKSEPQNLLPQCLARYPVNSTTMLCIRVSCNVLSVRQDMARLQDKAGLCRIGQVLVGLRQLARLQNPLTKLTGLDLFGRELAQWTKIS